MVLEQVPCRDVKIVMGDMNAKVGMDNTGREEVMGMHGARAEMNENGERWVDFCQANELVIGGTLFPIRSVTSGPGGLLMVLLRIRLTTWHSARDGEAHCRMFVCYVGQTLGQTTIC